MITAMQPHHTDPILDLLGDKANEPRSAEDAEIEKNEQCSQEEKGISLYLKSRRQLSPLGSPLFYSQACDSF